MEGRWLRDDAVIDDYARFWFQGSGWRMQYTWWPAFALWQRAQLLQPGAAGGILADIAPTVLTMMGLDIPAAMSGRNLLIN